MTKKVILYIAMSLDGFIARKNGSVNWLDKFNSSEQGNDYKEFFDSIDTVVMGSTTYQQILGFGEFPYKSKNCFVFSKKIKEGKYVKFINQNVKEFIQKLDPKENKKIWLVGGANLVNQFLKYNLIDEFIIFTMPILLGNGIKLFDESNKELPLVVKKTKSFKTGVIESHYERA